MKERWAKDFPTHNVGVVSRRGVGKHIFLDIDAEGVLQQIENEAGNKMPETYTVASRPDSAPFKRHFIFTQTPYSVSRFSKETNVKSDDDITRYDLKGCGGGGLVVAAGSVRESGEVYTCIDDLPVIPIPDWLVDWLVQDIAKCRASKAARTPRKLIAAQLESRTPISPHSAENHPTGDKILPGDRWTFLRSRAGSLASLGVRRTSIERLLAELSEDFCEDGKRYAVEERDAAHKLAHSPTLVIGHARTFVKNTPEVRTELKLTYHPSRHELMVDAMKEFPDSLPASEGYTKLEQALADNGLVLDRTLNKHIVAVYKARKAAGFQSKKVSGMQMWKKSL